MVTIIDVKQNQSKDGELFTSLVVQGELQLIKSEKTGNYYAAVNKVRIPSYLPLEVCKSLIGTTLPGSVERVQCEPYTYQNLETGEVVQLSHTYAYTPQKEESKMVQPMNPYMTSPQQYMGQQQFQYPQQQVQNQIPLDMMNNLGMVAEA